jgi:RNA polymerase sigma-70 factor (ECF subfamily)
MSDDDTTAVVERSMIALAGDAPADPIVRAPLDRAVGRMRLLHANLLHRSSPRLVRPPSNSQMDEVLAAVVERLLKAVRWARTRTVHEFFSLSRQDKRRGLNDLAHRLDGQPSTVEPCEDRVVAAESSDCALGQGGRRMLGAIGDLPEDDWEIFNLARIQGLTHAEASQLLSRPAVTVKRQMNRGLRLLSEQLTDLRPGTIPAGSI